MFLKSCGVVTKAAVTFLDEFLDLTITSIRSSLSRLATYLRNRTFQKLLENPTNTVERLHSVMAVACSTLLS